MSADCSTRSSPTFVISLEEHEQNMLCRDMMCESSSQRIRTGHMNSATEASTVLWARNEIDNHKNVDNCELGELEKYIE